jgi:phosphohistidine phosphatase
MNHRLFLMRHAEAVPTGTDDRGRPLSPKGKRDAQIVAEKMVAFKAVPDYVLCSPARRTRETYDSMLKVLPEVSVIYPEFLYNASTERLFKAISTLSETSRRVLVVSHNPSIQSLVTSLAHKGDHEALSQVSYGYRPATLSIVDCNCKSWNEIQPEVNMLKSVITP